MPLTNDENAYFESLSLERSIAITQKYESLYNAFFRSDDVSNAGQRYRLAKNHAKEAVETRITALMETYQKYNKFPTREEYKTFAESLAPFSDRMQKHFTDYLTNPMGPVIPNGVSDALLSLWPNEVGQIIGIALMPLQRLVIEGNREDKLEKKVDWVFRITVFSLVITVLGIAISLVAAVYTPEIRKLLGLQ